MSELKSCFMCTTESEVVDSSDELCSECVKSITNPSFLYCDQCEKLWGIVDPGPVTTEFFLEPGKQYTTNKCSYCIENINSIKLEFKEKSTYQIN